MLARGAPWKRAMPVSRQKTFVSHAQIALAGQSNGHMRIFSPHTVPRLCVTIGHRVNEFSVCSGYARPNLPIRTQ